MKTTMTLLLAILSFVSSGQNSSGKQIIKNPVDTIKLTFKLNYPTEAKRNDIQGTVKVKFTFDSDCNIIKHEIIKSLGYGCDEESLTALKYIEQKIKQIKEGNCENGDELIFPFHFKLD